MAILALILIFWSLFSLRYTKDSDLEVIQNRVNSIQDIISRGTSLMKDQAIGMVIAFSVILTMHAAYLSAGIKIITTAYPVDAVRNFSFLMVSWLVFTFLLILYKLIRLFAVTGNVSKFIERLHPGNKAIREVRAVISTGLWVIFHCLVASTLFFK